MINAFMNSQKNNMSTMEMSGWKAALTAEPHGEGSSGHGDIDSMADTMPHSPLHQLKRRRLSKLLDKLTIQLWNNNEYPTRWLMIDAPAYEPEVAPLDLSLKSEPQQSAREPEPRFECTSCDQTFTVHDRLAKHVASRHRNRASDSTRIYECEVCNRKFARSDMLTRHARLHSGIKPYSCSACGQVFSRSDHLATHQRTHTGEKPYRCPACPYAACRRDMITRHMRTHTKRSQPV